VAQQHYKLYVGPSGTSITDYANFITYLTTTSQLQFSLTNLKISGQPVTTDQGEWSLNINFGDISQADSSFLLSTDPEQPCLTNSAIETNFYSDSDHSQLILDIDACNVKVGYYYISVGLPANYQTSYTYDLLAKFVPLPNDYIPTYSTLNSKVVVNDVVGNFYYIDAYEQNFYLLNISQSTYKKGDYFFVTVYGIDFGSVSVEITQGCLGFDTSCSACKVLAVCNSFDYYDYSADEGVDYCKLKIDPCDINFSNAAPFFVSVRGSIFEDDNYDFGSSYGTEITYSILFEYKTVTPIDITTLPKTTGVGYTDYTYAGKVYEQDYDHFSRNSILPRLLPSII